MNTLRLFTASAFILLAATFAVPASAQGSSQDVALIKAVTTDLATRVENDRIQVAHERSGYGASAGASASLAQDVRDELRGGGMSVVSVREAIFCPDQVPSPACSLADPSATLVLIGGITADGGQAQVLAEVRSDSGFDRQRTDIATYRVSLSETDSGWSVTEWELLSIT